MVIVCPGCKNQITLDDATLPAGAFKVRCTGCGKTITTQRKEEPAASAPSPSAATGTEKPKASVQGAETPASSVESYVNAQVAAAKKEILDAMQSLFRGGSIGSTERPEDHGFSKRALVCSGDSKVAETLLALVRNMGYDPLACSTAAESLKNLDTIYGLIVIDPSFTDDLEGAKKLIGRINTKKGAERRKIFVTLLSSTQKSMDGNSAFLTGVNLIVNKADVNNLESYVMQSQKDFRQLYSAFRNISEER